MALSAAQIPELKGKIKGVVSWYPVLDFTISPVEKQRSRSHRNTKDTDDLKDWGPIWEWAYVRPGQDLRYPLLSVRYANKPSLPAWVYIISAEYDMLANEARQTMFDLASLGKMEREEGFYNFEKDTYKWTLVRDVRHGFTHDLMDNPGQDIVVMNQKRTAEMIEDVGAWLLKGPLAK